MRFAIDRTSSKTTKPQSGPTVVLELGGDAADSATNECRCLCGSLLARWLDAGLELKCRRCKRVIVVPWPELGPPPHRGS